MSDFLDHCESELKAAGLFDEGSDYGGLLGKAVMDMCRQFDTEGHSGFSAAMAINLFSRLARFEPISPLTGEDDEWTQVADGTWQNKRSPRAFKGVDGRAYDIDAVVFREPGGATFTSSDSRRFVEFPYTPTTEYVDAPTA